MSTAFDVAIVGLGAMGSACAYQLARRGQRVLGVDRYAPPHDLGSSHGRTRMTREAYHEDPVYVPLVQRAQVLWTELERAAGGRVLQQRTGGVIIGPEQGALVRGTLQSIETHHLPHEVLDARAIHRRYPAFAPLDDMVGVVDPHAGMLFPEPIIEAHLALAERHGAELRRDCMVAGWERTPDGLALRVGDETLLARTMVVAAGAWLPTLLPDLGVPFVVERQVTHWFDPAQSPEYFGPDRMPVSLWELHNGSVFHATPDVGDGVKIGTHHGGRATTVEGVDRRVSDMEDALVYDLLRRFIPFAKGHPRDRRVCLYTNTPDRHFVVDRHPSEPEVIILSACSGHGFKFASVLGEVVADLLISGSSSFDLTPFALSRFGTSPAP